MVLIMDSPRGDAIFRLAFLLLVSWWLLPFLFTITVILAIVWMVIDVVLQLFTGGAGWREGSGGGAKMWLERIALWPLKMSKWMIFGHRDFPWLP